MIKCKIFISVMLVLLGLFGCKAQRYHVEEYSQYKVYTDLDNALKDKSEVKILVLANKELREFPMKILELRDLKVLNLYNNKIEYLPDEIEKLKNLERLDLMKNNLKGLPHEITNLKMLKRINVAYNGLNDEDVKFIKEALPNCLVITEITL